MKSKQHIILFGHHTLGLSFFQDLKAIGYPICYIGEDDHFARNSEIHIKAKIPEELTNKVLAQAEYIKSLNPIGVICQVESLLPSCAKFSTYLNLAHNLEKSYMIARNKYLTRKIQNEKKLLNTHFEFYNKDITFEEINIKCPFIIKPNFGVASTGVFLINNATDFNQSLKKIKRINNFLLNKNHGELGYLCEEYKLGIEISVESISRNGKVYDLLYCEKYFRKENPFNDYIYSTVDIDPDIKSKINHFLTHFFHEIGYFNGPSHSEFIISEENNEIYFLEAGLRVGYLGNLGRLAELSLGLKYNQLAICSSLAAITNQDIEEKIQCLSNHKCLSVTPYVSKKGKIKSFNGINYLKSNKHVVSYTFEKKEGDFVSPPPLGTDVIGEIVIKLPDDSQVLDIINEIEENFEIEII